MQSMKRKPQPPKLIRLEIACGQNKEAGWVGVDIVKTPVVDIVHDLNKMPWPIASESVEEARCSHYLEHIPMLCACAPSGKQDPLLAFFDELYRIMVVGGKVTIITPYWANGRAFQDPTHRRFIPEATYLYANKGWRDQNKLNHYNVCADFDFTYSYSVVQEWAMRDENARQFAMKHYVGVIQDLQSFLTKRPASPANSGVLVEVTDSNPRVNGKPDPKLRRSVCKV